jgi:molybdopterin molybdotransferase
MAWEQPWARWPGAFSFACGFATPEAEVVLEFEAALAEVLQRAVSLLESIGMPDTEEVPLLEAATRVLARPVVADRDQPPFDRATRDGFAVRAEEFSAGRPLRVIGQVRAGEAWTREAMAADEAIEIMTGAPLPAGADAVAMIEHVAVDGGTVQATGGRRLQAGANFVPRGSEARTGKAVVAAGALVGAAEIAQAATCGLTALQVFARPKVAIVATGDELVEVHQVPDAWQIRNSNSYAIAAMVKAAGGVAVRLESAQDTREDVRDRVTGSRSGGLMLLSGGVSMGKYDLVEEVLAEFGAEFFFTGVKMQPGKPLVFGRLPEGDGATECFFFGLPGNPISTQVTFHCFVEPFLRVVCGADVTGPKFVQATLEEDVPGKPGLMRVLPASLRYDLRQSSVRLVGWQGSGDLAANARANCYAMLPPEREEFRRGDVISVLLR